MSGRWCGEASVDARLAFTNLDKARAGNPSQSIFDREVAMSSKPLKGSEPGNERRGFVSRLIRHRSDNDSKRPVAATSPAVASPPHPADDNQWPPKARIPPQEIRSQKAEVSPVGTAPQPTAQLTSAPSKKNRRAEAETRLQNAATTLSESMSKSPAKVPETIGLQQLDNIKDVEGTAKQLESAVDRIIDAREIKVSAESRRLWKDCIQKWYKAMYPYVKVGLKGVKVRIIFFWDDRLGFCSYSVWLRC